MSTTLHALLWSKSQNCFHVEELTETAAAAFGAFIGNSDLNDYHPIAIGTEEQVRMTANQFRYLLRERQQITHHQPT